MTWQSERGRVASLSRSRKSDDPDLLRARRALEEQRLDERIKKLVDEAPPLTEAQRTRLAMLLRSAGGFDALPDRPRPGATPAATTGDAA